MKRRLSVGIHHITCWRETATTWTTVAKQITLNFTLYRRTSLSPYGQIAICGRKRRGRDRLQILKRLWYIEHLCVAFLRTRAPRAKTQAKSFWTACFHSNTAAMT